MSVTVKVTVYVPASVYVWLVYPSELLVSILHPGNGMQFGSSKSQSQEIILCQIGFVKSINTIGSSIWSNNLWLSGKIPKSIIGLGRFKISIESWNTLFL